LFIALSLAVAIIGNCFRVVGIILIAHFMGNTHAIETGHVLWGWLFYLIIGSVLMLIGLAFRQEGRPQVRSNAEISGRTTRGSVIAFTLITLLASMPPLAANYLDQLDTGSAGATQIDTPTLTGFITVPLPPAAPIPSVEDGLGVAGSRSSAYRCGDDRFVLTLRRYPPRIGVRPLFSSLRSVAMPPGADIILQTGDL
jgi:hypothetical protein